MMFKEGVRYVILKKYKARTLKLIIFLLHDRYYCLQERPELKLSSHGRKMTKFGRPAPEIKGLVAASELSPLIACVATYLTMEQKKNKF